MVHCYITVVAYRASSAVDTVNDVKEFATASSGTDRAWAAASLTVGVIGGKAGCTGVKVTRSFTQRAIYLKSIITKSPKWMKPYLSRGKVPPGYNVDHVKGLSAGGKDVPSNMRLRTIREDHKNRHRHYHPWR